MRKNRRHAIMIILILSSRFAAWGLDFDSGTYGTISDYLNAVYGPDENAGLTSFPVLNVPMGGRSEGMAGAFTAVADDISFMEYNPAGSSKLDYSELALFHNNWIADTKIEGLAYTNRIKNYGFGAQAKWLYTPFTEYNIYGDRVSKGYYSEAVGTLNFSYNFLSRYSFSGLSAGINIKGAFRIMPDYTDADDLGNSTGQLIAGSGKGQSAAMAMADVGLLTRFNFLKGYPSRENNTSAALVIRNLGPPAGGDPLPTVAVAALSYKPLRPLLFAFDYSIPINLAEPRLSEKPYWAAGVAVQATSFLSMRIGLMGRSGNVRVTAGSAVEMEKFSIEVNYTLDLLTQLQPLNRVSLGLRLNMGDGGRKALAQRVDALYLEGLEAYSNGDFARAKASWEEALALNPRYKPAQDGLNVVAQAEKIESRIQEMQILDY
jgi:hypothetical protein